MTSAIRAVDLSVGYSGLPVVHGIDLQVDPGEVVVLLGANGAGKSTIMQGLCGISKPLEGVVELGGAVTNEPLHRRARRGLRYVPEERAVVRSLSTLDNLRLGPGSVSDAVELFPELKPLLGRAAGLLSGGEQQILVLARALAGQPKIVLADELSLGLAPLIVDRLLEAIRRAADSGVAILLVEQHVRAALSVADRGYVLRRGKIELDGSATELTQRMSEIESTYLSATE